MIVDPIISIYITNKNYGKYLENAIKSVLKQTYKKKELIIIDDASKDNSIQIIKKYEEKNLCRAIYNKKSKGLIKSSNIAIKASKGRFVMRLDADDYLDPNSLSVLLNAIEKDSNIALVYSDYYLVDEKRNILSLEKQTIRNEEGLLDHKPVLAACCLIRRSSIFSVNLYDERFTRQDGYDLWYKLLKNFKFEHVPLPLFFYRKHGKNLTKNQNKLYKTRTKILRKFSEKKNKIKDLNINCVIPVRGPNVDKFCNSLEIINKKPLICHTIDEALKVSEFKKIIITTSDKKLIIFLKKIYKKKIFYHQRSLELSKQNFDFKKSVTSAVIKFNTLTIDILVIMTIENPFRKYFYLQQAISNLIIHDSDLVIGAIPDLEYNYYQYSKIGIRLISNQKNQKLKLEKNVILKDVGAFSVYRYNSYINSSLKKITNVILDDKHAFMINNKADLTLAKKINHNK
jgi:glycosyltransferase involved in cell wall biosynthesis